jgi:hypothetical protein
MRALFAALPHLPDNDVTRPGFEFAAGQNDWAGAAAFRTLDQQIFKTVERIRRLGL